MQTDSASVGSQLLTPMLGLDIPLSPISPSTQPSPVDKARKYSPLTDLIESEKAYVELLAGVIRKVAAAWSRSNLPPRELDLMFRSVEGVYKTNRALLAKLKEIGENPSSPKALGDLLMRWIDELEQPYVTYADKYCIGFDEWEPVKSNTKLPAILQTFSASNPPPSNLSEPAHLIDPSLWTLDALFLLPKARLHYYRKLYSRLLRSMTPGRSDHRLLTGALEKLDGLLTTLDERANASVASPPPQIPPAPSPPRTFCRRSCKCCNLSTGQSFFQRVSLSVRSSTCLVMHAFSERLSQETGLTSASRESSQILPSPVLDLQRRLATESTLDIFTMQPKQIRLQIVSASLPYTRELRLSAKVVVRFTPKATGVEVIHYRGHVFILSDLFLLCEEMSREEKVARGDDGQDMHLRYPPLSGKVLSVSEVPGQDHALQVSIMRKETIILEADSQLKRDRILIEFQECASFSKTISRAAQEPVPPMPPIGDLPQLSVPVWQQAGFYSPAEYKHSTAVTALCITYFGPSRRTSPALRHHTSMHSLRQQPLQHQPSLHSIRHGPNHPNFTPAPHPPPGPHPSNRQPFPPHPSSPPVVAHVVEQPLHRVQKSLSTRSLHAQYQYSQAPLPPIPSLPDGLPMPQRSFNHRNDSTGSLNTSTNRPLLPSMQMGSRTNSVAEPSILDPSPPTSPAEERSKPLGPVRSVVTAQTKCKVFHQQQHAQWKSLGSANLTLYRQEPTNVKQLVVEASSKEKSILISTIVLTDGVERVGKTGVAIELSDAGGSRTGVVYMIQLRNEDAADGLYKALLAGSDRAG
ncbi:hypothetical protein JVU11DRAFT_5238, partial [Chiua virens]